MPLLNTISIATHKGGVGKTTTSINLSHALALQNQRVLIIDLDPQAHASRSLGIDRSFDEPSVADLFTRRDRPSTRSLIVASVREHLDLLPSSIRLASKAEQAVNMIRRENLIKEAIAEVARDYDFIVIDTPPGLGVLMANSIEAADRIIIPVDSGARAVDGLSDFLDLVNDLRGPSFRRWRILRTMINRRASKTEHDQEERLAPFSKRLLKTVIYRSETANRSHYRTQTVFEFDPKSTVARDYSDLAREVLAFSSDSVETQEYEGLGIQLAVG
jgi:chromosome partitioning protein